MASDHGQEGPPARVLVVAGADNSAGAGLQADLKTIAALGGYALTVVTAITVQDTRGLQSVHPLAPSLVAQQMRAVIEDIGVDAVKLGMLGNAQVAQAVAEVLAEKRLLPVVADPVLAASSGGGLLRDDARLVYLDIFRGLVHLITPNLQEAAILTGCPVGDAQEAEEAARMLADHFPAVLVSGGHLPGETSVHHFAQGGRQLRFESRRWPGPGFHGTGCTLASAMALFLARGEPFAEAVEAALRYVEWITHNPLPWGGGQRLLDHFYRGTPDGDQ